MKILSVDEVSDIMNESPLKDTFADGGFRQFATATAKAIPAYLAVDVRSNTLDADGKILMNSLRGEVPLFDSLEENLTIHSGAGARSAVMGHVALLDETGASA